jgi:hypothetical protein
MKLYPHFCMLMDGGHRQAGRQQIQPPDALLEGRVHGRLARISAQRNTSDLPQRAGAPHQPPQRRPWDPRLRRDSGLGGPGKHVLHSAPIPVKVVPLLCGQRGGIKGRARHRRARCEGDGSFHDLRC